MNTPSKSASIYMLSALSQYLDSGGANATIAFYDDTKPASTSVAANNAAKLLTLSFPKPCLKLVSPDVVELYPTNAGLAIKTGTAVWARLFSAAGEVIVDVAVGTDIVLDNADLVVGASVKLDAVYLSPPV